MPTSSDLVTDLPADFEVFGQAVDTALVDLKGGTTNQVLAKNSNTDMDFKWVTDATGMTNPMTTTGDTIYSSSGSTPARLGIGSTGQVLTVSGGVPTWANAGAAATSYALLNTGGTALTGAGTITVSGLSGYNKLFVRIDGASSASAGVEIFLRLNSASTNYVQNHVSLGASSTYAASSLTAGTESTKITLAYMSNVAASQVRAFCNIDGANSAGIKTFISTGGGTSGGGTDQFALWGGGTYTDTNVISSVSILTGAGNFDNGTIFIYGAN